MAPGFFVAFCLRMLAYAKDLLEVGGRNPYGEPTFILTRGCDPIQRAGGGLEHADVAAQYRSAWVLLEWLPAEHFGSPFDWPGEAYGPYPERGRYVALQPFPNQRLDTLYLNSRIVRMMAWHSREHRRDSLSKRQRALRAASERADAERQNRMADMLQDAFPSFTGPTSFANNPTTRTAVQNKYERLAEMERRGELQHAWPRGQVMRPS